MGSHKSMVFTPPPVARASPPADPVSLYEEPEDHILLLGEMMQDVETMNSMLRGLAFSRDSYRGNLRVIMGASERIKRRAAKLIGEMEK